MSGLKLVAAVLIVLGAFLNFFVPVALKKQDKPEEDVMKSVYGVKTLGLIMVIIGCVMIFWLGGKFGV